MSKSKWTRTEAGDYVFRDDTRFKVVGVRKTGYAGAHGDRPVFGRMTSDGNTYTTGWNVMVEGSGKFFGLTGKLADRKADVLRDEWREWVLGLAEEEQAKRMRDLAAHVARRSA